MNVIDCRSSANAAVQNLDDLALKKYPIEKFECVRNDRIKAVQKNVNPILSKRCKT